jgi:hypothetical protein
MSLRGTKQSRTLQGGCAFPHVLLAIASYLAITWLLGLAALRVHLSSQLQGAVTTVTL